MNSLAVAGVAEKPFANFGINAGLLLGGTLLGVCVVFLARKVVRRTSWDKIPHLLVVIDALLVTIGTIITSGLELWRKQVWTGLDVYAASGYIVVGCVLALGVGSKWLLSITREVSSARLREMESARAAAIKARDIALNVEALINEVMKAKVSRLAERRRSGSGSLEHALAPRKQIHILIQVLHGHFAKRLAPNFRLRIGIYQLGDDEKTLDATYSWDGQTVNCFSNKHRDFMRITSPGGGRSVVVECWVAPQPFQFVADGEVAQREGKFRYFYSGQEKCLRSMAAYRHNLSDLSADDAFIITLDTNQPGFFSADVESECRLLLPAFSRRLELELLALPITSTLESPTDHDSDS